ncbi:MAG: YkgJ family cysteine cluster protein [Desulfovibrio sp.]|nr:YkgJ family cysteine cluster protein [Desulfovibrio sp.]MBI4960900.1 YkgJ family cysteine cluster protein [Desulfovibrio sp.]
MTNAYCDGVLTPTWLQSLIKAQAIMDSGVRLAVRQEVELRGIRPSCGERCSGCCSSSHLSATSLEVAGALWRLSHDESPVAQKALARFTGSDDGSCPFLVEGTCAVYSMRFLSCRQLVVFGRACSPDENPLRTRRSDVLTPLRQYAFKAYASLLPHLDIHFRPSDPIELEALLGGLLRPAGAHKTSSPADLVEMIRQGRCVESSEAA